MSQHAVQTTVVGSYPVPAWLLNQPTRSALRDAVMTVLKTQELAGIDVVADGELSRFNINHPETNGMIDYFVAPLDGITTRISRRQLDAFREQHRLAFRRQPAGIVTGPVDEGALNLPADWDFVRELTERKMKFTVTSPYMLAKTLVDEHYSDVRELSQAIARVLAAQIAKIDCNVLQVDEAHLPGHPEDAAWAAEPINIVLDASQGLKALHLCFGNYGGQSIQKGFWKDLIAFFNQLHVDHLVLEFARRGFDELDAFKALRPDISLGVGVIDIKDNVVESDDTVARRIDQASKILGPERIRWVHPDCGFWMLPRSVADRKMQALVAGRDRFAHAAG